MRAVTVGSATVDIIATVASDDIERMTLHNSTASFLLLEPGRKVDATGVITRTGGGAVNAAISLARQGFEVSALVKLGDDHNAEKVMDRLREERISTALVRYCDKELTAVSVMIASHDRNAAIFTHRGANCSLTDDDVAPGQFRDADLVYVTNLSNQSADRFPDVVARAKAEGAFVAANPGIRQLTQRTDAFFDSLEHIDLVVGNFEEARALVPALVGRTGWTGPSSNASEAPALEIEGFRLTLEDYGARLRDLGPRYVAVTHGGDGAYLFSGDGLVHQPAEPVEVQGTVGAGDAFASTLAAGLAQGATPVEAARAAARNAASVVGYVDAQTGLLTRDQLGR